MPRVFTEATARLFGIERKYQFRRRFAPLRFAPAPAEPIETPYPPFDTNSNVNIETAIRYRAEWILGYVHFVFS
jgi:hypothetical protein